MTTVTHQRERGSMSESVEMYLVMTALERKGNQPVQLSILAEKLSISAVSANEMCHKLAERGLIDYQPYKGVTLTDEGEVLAQRVLIRRRVWEAFLVRDLAIEPEEATEMACQLEHVTSDKLVAALEAFLQQTTPPPSQPAPECPTSTLATLTAGQHGQIVRLPEAAGMRSFLSTQGLHTGSIVEVLAVGADGSRLLNLGGNLIALAHAVADRIVVLSPPHLL